MSEKITASTAIFTAAGKNVILKPYEVKDQTYFLPFLKAPYLSNIKKEKGLQHVIYNNILYILIGTSDVIISKPSFGDTEVRYLDDKSVEPVFDSLIVLKDSALKVVNDSAMHGSNYLEESIVSSGDHGMGLTDAVIIRSQIHSQFAIVQNATLEGSSFDSDSVMIRDSKLHDCALYSAKTISIHNSIFMRGVRLGYSSLRATRGLNAIKMQVNDHLFADDNTLTSLITNLPEDEVIDITIESRIDFSPITAINGRRFSTTRAGDRGIIVGHLFISKTSHYQYAVTDALRDEIVAMILERNCTFHDLKPGDKIIVNDFIDSIHSRLQVYDYFNNKLL